MFNRLTISSGNLSSHARAVAAQKPLRVTTGARPAAPQGPPGAMRPQRELDLEGPFGMLPVRSQQSGDSVRRAGFAVGHDLVVDGGVTA